METRNGWFRRGGRTTAPLSRPEIIAHCVLLYHRFTVSLRDIEQLMLARGIIVSHETIRT
ncbi:transposase-like protein [Rhodococcus sp. 27YEA15]